MLRSRFVFLIFMYSVLNPYSAFANEFPVLARFFLGATSINPKNVNDSIGTQGFNKIDGMSQYGFEADYSLLRYLDVGVRYTKRLAQANPASGTSSNYYVKADQDAVLLVARTALLKSDLVRIDAFAGFGGSNTTLSINTTGQSGDLTRRASGDWFASPYTAVGGSVAIGYKKYYLVIEGGVETNKVDGFKRSGTVSSNIDSLDLSGSYMSIGFLIDGLTGSTK
ncbi:MAG: hypothetical protein ACXVCY_13470 [Pseudobdellovibrionaceae bacterium]